MRDVNVGLRLGAEKATISAWEQRHGVSLPHSLKQFYSAADGFSLTWNYSIAGKLLPLGNLEIHPLSRLSRVVSGRSTADPLTPSLTDILLAEDVPASSISTPVSDIQHSKIPIGRRKSKEYPPPSFHISKLFEIDNVQGHGRVVLAYPGRGEMFPEASFWFIDLSLKLHLLTTDASTYWRLLLVHLGLPQWQALIVGLGLTPWARQWYEVIAPHLLEAPTKQIRPTQADLVNKLDWSVFKIKKSNKKSQKENQKGNNKEINLDQSKEKAKGNKDNTK